MKSIIFGIDTRINPQDEHPYIVQHMFPYSEANMEIAKEQSYNGEYVIEDIQDEPHEPTQLDRIEAQTTYTAMMTDTLLEG